MKKILGSLAVLFLVGCGSSGGGSSSSSSSSNSLGENFIRLHAVANQAVSPQYYDRKIVILGDDEDKDENLVAYIDRIKDKIVCKSGSFDIGVINQVDKCGIYRIAANNCVTDTNFYNGLIDIETSYYTDYWGDYCIFKSSNIKVDYAFNTNILGKEKNITIKKGFTKTTSNDDDSNEYRVIANGDILFDGKNYHLKNYTLELNNEKFEYVDGYIDDGEYKLDFVNEPEYVRLSRRNKTFSNGKSVFIYDGVFYDMIVNQAGVFVVNEQNETLSSFNDFFDIYRINWGDYADFNIKRFPK